MARYSSSRPVRAVGGKSGAEALKKLLNYDAVTSSDTQNLFEDFFAADPRAGIQAVSPYLGGQALALRTNPWLVFGEMERREMDDPGTGRALDILLNRPTLRRLTSGLSPFERGQRPEVFRGQHRTIYRR